jgi:CshA-type fibril repeat protein
VTVTITPVIDIANDTQTTTEDTAVTTNLLTNDSFEGIPLITAVTQGAHGTVINNNDGTVTYTPNPDYNGTDSYTYTVTSPAGVTETATVTVIVNGIPITTNDTVIDASGHLVIIDVLGNDTDPENDLDPSTVKIVGATNADGSLVVVGQGIWTVNPTTGAITFTPIAGFTGDPTPISYTVQDRTGLTSAAATVTVDYPQTAPLASNDTVIAVSGQTVIIDVLGNDNDAQNDLNPASIKIVGVTNADGSLVVAGEGTWSVNLSTGTIIFTPLANFIGNPTPITYTIQDYTGLISNPAIVSINYLNTLDNIQVLLNSTLLNQDSRPFETQDLNHIDSSSRFVEEEKKREEYQKTRDSYNSSAQDLFMYQPIRHYQLDLWGSLRNQVVLEKQSYSFDIPSWAFRHTDPNAKLEFSAKRANGMALPAWLTFNPNTLKFSGTPPKGAVNERVTVTVKDQYGNEVHASFNVYVNKERVIGTTKITNTDPSKAGNSPNNDVGSTPEVPKVGAEKAPDADKQQPDKPQTAVGRFGFSEQVQVAGKLSRLQESRALLDSLKDL